MEQVTLDNNVTYSFNNKKALGAGNQGSVFKAKSADGSLIALKIVEKKSSRDDREYTNLLKINHPSVVKVLGQATEKRGGLELLAIGMELVAGESYDEYLKRNGKIDWQEAAEDFRQLITGMQAVHEQVHIQMYIHKRIAMEKSGFLELPRQRESRIVLCVSN